MKTMSKPSTPNLGSQQNNYGNYTSYVRTANGEGMYCSGALALVLRLCACACVAPLRARRDGAGWRFHVSSTLAVLQAVTMTTLNLILVTVFIIIFCQSLGDEKITYGVNMYEDLISILDAMLIQIVASLVIYRGEAQMENLRRVLHLYQQIKSDLGTETKKERMKCVTMIIMLLGAMTFMMAESGISCYLMLSGESIGLIQIVYCMTYISYIVDLQGLLAVMKWACTVQAVHEGAVAVNQHLKRLQNESNLGSVEPTNGSGDKSETLIQRLALSHKRIGDMVMIMNGSHGLFLTVLLLSTFLRFVVTIYYLVFQHEHASAIPLAICWILTHLSVLTLIVEPCHRTHSEREYTAILLGELIVQHQGSSRPRLSSELDQFAKQLMLSNTKFSAYGVYTLDRQLTAALLGGVTTYSIILIQTHSTTT